MATIIESSSPEVVANEVKYEVSNPRSGYYEVKQVEPEYSSATLMSASRKSFDVDIKIVKVSGYVDPDEKEIGASVYILGVQVGSGFQAGFNTGIEVSVFLGAYNGSVKLFVDGKALKCRIRLTPILPFMSDINEEAQLLNW